VDFVLCDSSDLSLVAAIELDDKSHKVIERGIRDSLVDQALQDACIPVLRFEAKQSYAPAQIQERLETLMRRGKSVAKATQPNEQIGDRSSAH
jgi:hypothetical protein